MTFDDFCRRMDCADCSYRDIAREEDCGCEKLWLADHDAKVRADAIDEVKRAMYHQCFECDNSVTMQKWDGGYWIRYILFEKVINEMLKEQSDEKI